MTSNEFDFSAFFRHALSYFRARLKKEVLSLGDFANRGIKGGVQLIVFSLFAPIVLLLLFIALAFGFSSWLDWGLAASFLLSAVVALALCIIAMLVGISATKKLRANLLEKTMEQLSRLDKATPLDSEEDTPSPQPEEDMLPPLPLNTPEE